jgi:hypothetical protein
MSRPGGVLDDYSGRTTVRAPLPFELLAEADLLAEERGADRAVILGDLVAAALPDALADAARDLLCRTYDAETAPGLPGTAPQPFALKRSAGTSVPPAVPERGPGGGVA